MKHGRTIVLGTMAIAFVVLALALLAPGLASHKSYPIKIGLIGSTPKHYTVRSPNGWFSGLAITIDNGVPDPTQRIGITIRQGRDIVAEKVFDGSQFLKSNWHQGRGYVLQLRDGIIVPDHHKRLGYGSDFEITVYTVNMERSTVVLWAHFVDDRLLKWP